MGKDKFINPYNFIPCGKTVVRTAAEAEAHAANKTFTGVIEYSVLTKTPIFIPNTSNEDAFGLNIEDHKSYDFFSYADLSKKTEVADTFQEPVIPGSEMRGMIRSNYEILTNSCFAKVDGDQYIGKRTMEAFRAGLIRKKGETYDLVEAEDCLWRTEGENSHKDIIGKVDWDLEIYYSRKSYKQDKIEEGEKVFFTRTGRGRAKALATNVSKIQQNKEDQVGYVMKGEDGPVIEGANNGKLNKHCCHIFVPRHQVIKSDLKLSQLLKVLESYQEIGEHKYAEYHKKLKEFMMGTGNEAFPVYFSSVLEKKDKFEMVFLAPAVFTREVSDSKLESRFGELKECSSKEKLCPACSLFGTVNDYVTVSSRIRFADLLCKDNAEKPENNYEKPITLSELSSPKYNLEFYFKRPEDAVFWTFDYYFDSNGQIHQNSNGVNGRKFYWHDLSRRDYGQSIQKTRNETDPDERNALKRRSTVRPLKRGTSFSGKLYFEKLSKEELDRLIYVLNAGDEGDLHEKKHGYKIGTGKPLGMGSIAIKVDKVETVSYSYENHELKRSVSGYSYDTPNINKDRIAHYLLMTQFDALEKLQKEGYKMAYPSINGETEGFQWFTANHAGYDWKKQEPKAGNKVRSRSQMVYKEYLEPMSLELKKITVGSGENGSEGSSGSYSAANDNKGQQPQRQKPQSQKVTVEFISYDNRRNQIKIKDNGREAIIAIPQMQKITYSRMAPHTSIEVKKQGSRYELLTPPSKH